MTTRSWYLTLTLFLAALASAAEGRAQQSALAAPPGGAAEKYQHHKQSFNENTVTIVSGQTSGTYLKLAEDLQNVLERRADNALRILPVLGTPGPQNLLDVLFLKGVDMCMTETDYFDYFRELDPVLYGDIERKIHYIAAAGRQGRSEAGARPVQGRRPGGNRCARRTCRSGCRQRGAVDASRYSRKAAPHRPDRSQRLPLLAATETVSEAGFPGLESHAWWGMFTPAGTPSAAIDRFVKALRDVLSDKSVQTQLADGQQMALRDEGPEAFQSFFDEQMSIWGKVVKDNGVQINS